MADHVWLRNVPELPLLEVRYRVGIREWQLCIHFNRRVIYHNGFTTAQDAINRADSLY
jgi:hypothetical protein